MSYFWVLGYSENPLIYEYQERYFQKLTHIAKDILEKDHAFFQMDVDIQKTLLLHPDISSLLMNISQKNSKSSLETFEREISHFCSWNLELMVVNSWQKIGDTEIRLTLDDNNPENGVVGHPDHDTDGMLGWGEKSPVEWSQVFTKALALLQNVNIDFYNELNHIIKKIVPMKTSIDVHNSCSYKECVGTLYLWYTLNAEFPELWILEALIHESSHNKLNLIMQSEKLTLNDYELKYYSPYRPDARHIHGVYLWVHAIVPTVYVLLQAIEAGYIQDIWWKEKVILYHIKNKLWYRVLQKYAKTTSIGRKILDDISSVMLLSDDIIKNSHILSSIDKHFVSLRAKEHFIEVQINYPYLQY